MLAVNLEELRANHQLSSCPPEVTTLSVTIRYGPYESCGVVDYRTSRLIGLRIGRMSSINEWILLDSSFEAMLEASGHSWAEEQSLDWNIVELVVNGAVVFTCNITDLDFGGDGKLDPLCREAMKAVRTAY